jgi:hypothetical protein
MSNENNVVFAACQSEICRLHEVIRSLSLRLHEREIYITDLERSLEMKLIDGFD